MLLTRIRQHLELAPFVRKSCTDDGMTFAIDDRIEADDYVVIKVDDYFNSLGLDQTPPAPDCLIILRCREGGYALAIVELKRIKVASRFKVNNVAEKFSTCFDDFIEGRFPDLLSRDYKRIQLFFETKLKRKAATADTTRGLRLEALLSKRFKFRGRNLLIEPRKNRLLPCY